MSVRASCRASIRASVMPVTRNGASGVSLGPVDILVQPQSSSKVIGETASITIENSGTATIRWQRKDKNALGWLTVQESTNTTYNTPELYEFDDGVQYRAIVNPATQALISDTATITVAHAGQVFFADFLSDVDSFSAGTRVAVEGPYRTTGAISVGTSTTATRTFTAISSGVFRADCWVYCPDTDTVASGESADSFIYLMPSTLGVSLDNSITTILISRSVALSASSTFVTVRVRQNLSWNTVITGTAPRSQWLKLSIVANLSAKTFDVYFNDVCLEKGIGFSNATAADFNRVVLLGSTATPDTYFDAIRVMSSYVEPTESVVVFDDFTLDAGDIGDSEPDTFRTLYAQPWNEPQATATYGGLTRSSSGAGASGSLPSFANQQGLADGIIEAEFRTSVSGVIYFGINLRVWDYPALGSGGLFRISGGSTNSIVLILPNSAGTTFEAFNVAFTPTANTTYTLKLEMRGRRYIASYKAAAMDSGSYTVASTFVGRTSNVGGRGMLSEELFGPFFAPNIAATDNYCTKIRFTGKKPREKTVSIGHYDAVLSPGSIRQLYSSGFADSQRNLFWSKGIQFGHRSRADMGNYFNYWETIAESDNVASYRIASDNLTEYQNLGHSDCWATFTRRGIWVSDAVKCAGATENYAPDNDLNPYTWLGDYLSAGPTGSASTLSDLAYHDWRSDIAFSTLPLCFQRISNDATTNVRISNVGLNISNLTGSFQNLTHKYRGAGEPISHAMDRRTADITAGTEYRMARAYLIETGQSALSGAVLTEFRDDLKTPATFSFTTGSSKTDAGGDANTDGFNERHGWYEVTASGNALNFDNSATKRIQPIFRVHSMTTRPTSVSVGGVSLTENAGYWIDDLGSNQYLIQLAGDVAASAKIIVG